MIKKAFILTGLILVFSVYGISVDREVAYQGRVMDSLGQGVNDTSVPIAVMFYDAETDGNQIGTFSEEHIVTISNGLFSILIGSKTTGGIPSSIFESGSDVYLSISIRYIEQLPRPKIVYVPYSLSTITTKVDCADYPGTVDVGTFCIDQDWSPVVFRYAYDAALYCHSRNMILCNWGQYATACSASENGLISLTNIKHNDPYLIQISGDRSGTTLRGFGHTFNVWNATCSDDLAAYPFSYYPTTLQAHFRCCVEK